MSPGSTRVTTRFSNGLAGSTPLIGNGRAYVKAPYSLYSGVFSVFIPGNDALRFSLDASVFPTQFPAKTRLEWDVTPGSWGGINGYQHIDYGNYDDSPTTLTPKQTKNITSMMVDCNWTFPGVNQSGLLCECWLTPASHASGPVSNTAVFEVGFFPKCSPGSQAYAAGAIPVGSFVDVNGVTWNVGQEVSGVGAFPYFVATRNSYAEHQGVLDFKSYFAFLQTQGKITGNEWFNGVAFGPELYIGSGVVTVDTFATTYA